MKDHKSKNRRVRKSLKAKPAWLKMYKDMMDLKNETLERVARLDHMKKAMWVMIESDTGDYVSDMRWNEAGTEVEVLEDEDTKKIPDGSVLSPFQK